MAVEFADVDLLDRALSDLLSQDRGKPRIESFVLALAAGAEQMDDLFEALVEDRDLSIAVGALLDQWGGVVGQPRGALPSDVTYRRFIKARALANRSTGTRDELIDIAAIASGVVVHEIDTFPADYLIEWFPAVPFVAAVKSELRRIMDDARPMGIGAAYVEAFSVGSLIVDSVVVGERVDEGSVTGVL